MKRTALIALLMAASVGASAQSPSPSPAAEDPNAAIVALKKKVAALENALDAIQYPSRYVVIAIFDEPTMRAAAGQMKPGETSGLPTILHNWICQTDPCGSVLGNIVFFGRNDVPKEWSGANTHVAAKSFGSMFEANEWLSNSREGKWIMSKSRFVMGASVTEYSQTINGATPTVQQIRAIK